MFADHPGQDGAATTALPCCPAPLPCSTAHHALAPAQPAEEGRGVERVPALLLAQAAAGKGSHPTKKRISYGILP